MKLRTKDEIITRLIEELDCSSSAYLNNLHLGDAIAAGVEEQWFNYIKKGKIEALRWVLGLTEEEKNVFKDSEIISAIDLAIGDDGTRSKEVIAILEGERNE